MSRAETARTLEEEAYQAFRAGDNARSISLNNQVLALGQELDDETIVGKALTGLCRAALRDRDEGALETHSAQLLALAERSGNDKWRMFATHMNAEMARMNGDLERADILYDRSIRLGEALGSQSMVAAECFNKSFVAVAQGQFDRARTLLQRHFAIRDELDQGDLDPYGLIAVANFLAGEARVEDAAAVTYVCRRLFAERDIVPDPADEEPLNAVEDLCRRMLSEEVHQRQFNRAAGLSCREVVLAYVGLSGSGE